MITVLTPFSRKENKDFLIKVLEGKCNWIVLQAIGETDYNFPIWVTVKHYPASGKGLSNQLLNAFFKEAGDETQYLTLCDDDSVEDGFFDKIPDADVVCVSMQRNDVVTPHAVWDDWKEKRYHIEKGIDVLVAAPENMKVARVGGEQLICKGKVLKQFSYTLDDSTTDVPGDFAFIRDVIEKYPPVYVPEAKVYFNYFEDGRWQSFRRKPIVLFVGDYYFAGNPRMGLSEWEGNIWASLESTGLADVARFHFDKYFYTTGQRGDAELLKAIERIKPDYVVMIVYKLPGSDPTVIGIDTIAAIKVPIISIWGDLEAEEQQHLAKMLEPFMWKVVGTANKSVVEELGYTYLHVPKDVHIFNNPNKERDIDIVFSGSYGYGREERRESMTHLLNNGIKLVHGGSEGADHFTVEEYADRYKRAKLALSFSQARGMNVVNARPFEAMSCGAMLLEQESLELAKLYTPYVDYVPWTDKDDLLSKVQYYLAHDEERKKIADAGCKKTQEVYSANTFWEQLLK